MQLAFLNPLWLVGALALVPLLAHLFSRTRPRRRIFASVLLLREALRHVARVRQPRDRWLLLLRTAAMAALALAFLQPWLLSRFGGAGAARSVVIVVDVTGSMGFVDGTRTRLAAAASAAEDVLASLPTNSKANLVWAQAHPASVLPEPAPNLDFLRQTLRAATVRPESGSPAEALTLALRQLAGAEGNRELVVISDFQKTAWQPVRWEVPPEVRLTRIAVGEPDGGNVGLADLATEPERPLARQEARMVCRVRNFSPEPRRLTVYGQAGESRLSQAVEIAPWGETLAVLPVKFPAEGLVPLKATLAGDSFPADDVRYAIAEVRGALDVCIAAPADDATARVWLRAARALDQVTARRIEPAALAAAGHPDILMIAGWQGEAPEALRAQLARGGAVVVQPAADLDVRALSALLRATPLEKPAQPASLQLRDAPGWRTRIVHEEHPLFALFAKGSFGDPAAGRFRKRLVWPSPPPGTPVLAFEDGAPALTIASSLACWNLDLSASDWPAQPAFVPFFGELLQHLAQHSGTAAAHEVEAGEPLRFDPGAAVDARDLTLLNDQDQAVNPLEPPPPGSYRWMAQGSVLERAIVNFPQSESDLRRLTPAELSQGGGAVLSGAGREQLTNLREGRPLWPWCLAAVAACLLIEAGLLAHYARRAVEAPAT